MRAVDACLSEIHVRVRALAPRGFDHARKMARLLIVDDDVALVDALRALLQADGHHVSAAYDGAQGLQVLRSEHPDLILLDVEMPVLSGPQMVREMMLHDLGANMIPIILFSANPDLPKIASDLGTPYWIEKPCDADSLRVLVARAFLERLA